MITPKAIAHRQQLAADHAKLARLYMEHGMRRQACIEQEASARHYARARVGLGLMLLANKEPRPLDNFETSQRVELIYQTRASGAFGKFEQIDDHGLCGVTLADGRKFAIYRYPDGDYSVIAVPGGAYCSGATVQVATFQLLTEYPPT